MGTRVVSYDLSKMSAQSVEDIEAFSALRQSIIRHLIIEASCL